jgi:signal transduction histidine kinase
MRRTWSRLARQSLAARLFLSALVWCALVLLIAGLILSAIYRRSAERSFDERLQVYLTDIVADLAAPGAFDRKDLAASSEPRFELPLSGWYWQVTREDGGPYDFRASKSMFGVQLNGLAHLAKTKTTGEVNKGYVDGPEERRLRVVERTVDLGEDGRYLVAIAAPADEIESNIRQFSGALTLTFLLLGAALVLSTLLQVRFGLAPLGRLRAAIAGIRRGDAERLEGDYPPDIAPLAGELNLLIDANREILERARTQVGNLAHALKTPLSVLVNEADAAQGPLAEKAREQAGIMRDQINYYLDRARAAAIAGALGTFTEIAPVLDGLTRTLGKIYGRERELAVAWNADEGVRFRGERQDFEDMVGNLADNACKWAKGAVAISVRREPDTDKPTIAIIVDDDGPGMPEAARDEALERGRRLDETKPGSGLGLSIVVDLAELYGGTLAFDRAPEGGLRAVLRLPGI